MMEQIERITEQDAYNKYVQACHSDINTLVSEFNFNEWRVMGRPKTQYSADGYYPTPWEDDDENQC